jgi:hypothetical protein
MYQRSTEGHLAPFQVDRPGGLDSHAAARFALARVGKLLLAFSAPAGDSEMPEGVLRLRAPLSVSLADPIEEAERLFSLGWLRWLQGDWLPAIPLLEAALAQSEGFEDSALPLRASYWRARVGLLAGDGEAVANYEKGLRRLGGSAQATAWFVDLLWRAGQLERAEQVWKVARARCLSECPEGTVVEARFLLRRGEVPPAERLLQGSEPSNGVAWVERALLLAWALLSRRQREPGLAWFQEALRGPYPLQALERWRRLVQQRINRTALVVEAASPPTLLADYLRGQQARLENEPEQACAAYRAALVSPLARPFAHYALACLGEEDLAAVLEGQPGLFLAIRCRIKRAIARFRQRQMSPAELLDPLRYAHAVEYDDPELDHFRELARLLRADRTSGTLPPSAEETLEGPCWRNRFKATVERIVRGSPAPATREALLQLRQAHATRLSDEPECQHLLAEHLLRCLLPGGEEPSRKEEILAEVSQLYPSHPLLVLIRGLQESAGESTVTGETPPPALRLWRAARRLHQAREEGAAEAWREEVRSLRATGLAGPAQVLLLEEAAQRGQVEEVMALLGESPHWRGLQPAPPAWVLDLVERLTVCFSAHPGWKPTLGRWLDLWDPVRLGPLGATLATQAGRAGLDHANLVPPRGVPAGPWFLHQAAQALGQENAFSALQYVQRLLACDPDLASVPEASRELVHRARIDLERRAAAQQLYAFYAPDEDEGSRSRGGALLVDCVDQLQDHEQGQALRQALLGGNQVQIRVGLEQLLADPALSGRLAQHLALLEQKRALHLEQGEPTEEAEVCWRQAWRCWLRFLSCPEGEGERTRVIDWLLARHRRQINDLLARNAVDQARRYWNLLAELAGSPGLGEDLGKFLSERYAQFREQLATEYLVSTREAMRHGQVPEGWRSDYEKGMVYLRRLLSMDRDNIRLLTAVVEICGEWFFDLYNCGEARELRTQVERFTPFALQLARLVEDRLAELPARIALGEFYKVRGFLATEPEEKATLYGEALRFDPSNDNARALLEGLQGEQP